MIMFVQAGGGTPSAPELDKMTKAFGVDEWHHLALGTGPRGDSSFVDMYQDRFAGKVQSAILRIIDEMRDEVAAELMRLPTGEAAEE